MRNKTRKLGYIQFITQKPLTEHMCQSFKKRQQMQFEILIRRNELHSFIFCCELVTGRLWRTVTTHISPSSWRRVALDASSEHLIRTSTVQYGEFSRNEETEAWNPSGTLSKYRPMQRRSQVTNSDATSYLHHAVLAKLGVHLKGLRGSFSLCEDNPFVAVHTQSLSICRGKG